jgi:hypothetical protein
MSVAMIVSEALHGYEVAGIILLSRPDRPEQSTSGILVDGVHSLSEVMKLVVSVKTNYGEAP